MMALQACMFCLYGFGEDDMSSGAGHSLTLVPLTSHGDGEAGMEKQDCKNASSEKAQHGGNERAGKLNRTISPTCGQKKRDTEVGDRSRYNKKDTEQSSGFLGDISPISTEDGSSQGSSQ
jgi:hypothetical protein